MYPEEYAINKRIAQVYGFDVTLFGLWDASALCLCTRFRSISACRYSRMPIGSSTAPSGYWSFSSFFSRS